MSEWALPAVFVLAALVSLWVFHDARRSEGANPFAVCAWALLALLFPPAVLPLYLAARLYTRRAGAENAPTENEAEAAEDANAVAPRRPWPTLLYAAALGLLGVVYFYAEYGSFDARVARAERAKLYGRAGSAIAEYRGALRVREDARTRQLLGLELLREGRAEEALAELRAAAAAGPDTDGALHFDTAGALEALARREEAAAEYRRFLAGPLCARPGREPRCDAARARLGEAER